MTMKKPRLEALYHEQLRSELQKKLGLKNIMEVPRLEKIVVNVGVKDAVADTKFLQVVTGVLTTVTGQLPIRTHAKKSIAGFKIRAGMPLGVKVTLRRRRMYEFLDRLINLALPKVRDFQGVSPKLDRQGNYNLGIKEWVIFPEVDYEVSDKIYGMNITFHTSSCNDDSARELLKGFGMPFRKA